MLLVVTVKCEVIVQPVVKTESESARYDSLQQLSSLFGKFKSTFGFVFASSIHRLRVIILAAVVSSVACAVLVLCIV